MSSRRLVAALLAICLMLPMAAVAQEAPKHEFRGAWIASVTNLDWPVRGASTESQIEHLISILDDLQAAGINAVIFQVRPELDALYESELEPWSYWLTGEQGKAPEPFYDPLALAIEEAHKRGMELHAWFNPYRAERTIGGYPLDENHVSVRHPEWTFTVNTYRQLDPGLPEVREYVTDVVMDVVRRYDVDGIHFDDYFYPYPPNAITDQDVATFAAHPRGFTNIGDWRRNNVDLLIEMLNDAIMEEKPHVKFGMSPFGIWKNGVPAGITGLDAYNVIFADAIAWLEDQTIDYLSPQLYWKFGGGQDFAALANWWASQRNDRHMYPGIGAYKSDIASFWNPNDYTADEVPRQLRFTRDHAEIQGNIIFRSSNITDYPSKGLADSLRQNINVRPALTPPMTWKSMVAPGEPVDFEATWLEGEHETWVELSWEAPEAGEGSVEARRYAIYKVRAEDAPDFEEVSLTNEHLIAVTGETRFYDQPRQATTHYFVTSVSANSVESSAAVITLEGRATSSESEVVSGFALDQNYPNPFNPSTSISYAIDRSAHVSLRVFNALGQEVAVLMDAQQPSGAHVARFDARHLPSGTYFYVLEADGRRISRSMVLLK